MRDLLSAVLVSLNRPFVGNVPIKISIVSLGQALGDTIQALRYRGVSADDISAYLMPVLSSWALKDPGTVSGLPIPNVHILVGPVASIPLPCLLQGVLTKLATRSRFEVFTRALDALYEACPQERNPQ